MTGFAAVRCAGAIVFDDTGRLLLVRRRHEPSRGMWCEPSGRCEPGESTAQACVREAREESGLDVRVVRRLGAVRVPHEGTDYDIEDYLCEVVGGSLAAGDDADAVRWVTRAELVALPLVPGLEQLLESWGCLPD
jgi:8-oxo-dGTP diphosphatase